jgi:enoyl reductase-like protein
LQYGADPLDSDGAVYLDMPFSRLLGKPPIMVAGMTPTTVKADFVSAVLSAGYHVKLAGGGHYNAATLCTKVTEIQAKIPAGVGLTLNALYINLRQFTFQFLLWQEMRNEGLPTEGFCVAVGIPTTEKEVEIIDSLRSAGLCHVSFKPGSVDGIRQVINITAANPDLPIIMQWTGGRAGGHHTCEDFHQPIFVDIRRNPPARKPHPHLWLRLRWRGRSLALPDRVQRQQEQDPNGQLPRCRAHACVAPRRRRGQEGGECNRFHCRCRCALD